MKTNTSEDGAKIPPPTKEQLIAMMQEQIEIKTVQLQLQELNSKIALSQAEEIRAMAFVAQMRAPAPGNPYEGGVPHTVTQEDLDNNPELIEQGINVGDEVVLSGSDDDIDKPSPKRSLKKK